MEYEILVLSYYSLYSVAHQPMQAGAIGNMSLSQVVTEKPTKTQGAYNEYLQHTFSLRNEKNVVDYPAYLEQWPFHMQ